MIQAHRFTNERGQGTVEAAFVLPLLLGLVLLLVQPGIILYDRMVMSSAAVEACRLLTSSTVDYGSDTQAIEASVRHRLSAVPAQDLFHVHGSSCSWDIKLSGNEDFDSVAVTITNEVKPLPLLSLGFSLFNVVNSDGNLEITVTKTSSTQPSWTRLSGSDASSWVEGWKS